MLIKGANLIKFGLAPIIKCNFFSLNMFKDNIKFSVIIPLYNESCNIEILIKKFINIFNKLIISHMK